MSGNAEMLPCDPRGPIVKYEATEQVPLPLEEDKSASTAAAPLSFRGKPIAWVVVPTVKKIVLPNAFGEDEVEEDPSGA